MKTLLSLMLAVLLVGATVVSTEAQIRQEQIQFKKGASDATVTGMIKGDETVDYQLRAQKGQSMVAVLNPSNLAAYFNVLPPSSETAIFVGSTLGNRFEGELPADGVYTLRVYLMRSAARRNETAKYTLKVSVTGGGETSTAPKK